MKIDYLSFTAQDGLRLWAKEMLHDELALEGTASEYWAWVCVLLRVSPDRAEWFPKGKSATIQIIEARLLQEAKEELIDPHE